MLPLLFAPPQVVNLSHSDPRHKKDWEQCVGTDPAVAIKACTSVLDKRLELPEQLAVAYHARALAYAAKNQPDRALADLDEAIRLRPNYTAAISNRGNLRAGRHEYDLAIADFNEALRLNPQPTSDFNPASTLSDRASVYNSQGDYAHALADYNELLRRNPDDPQAFFHRGNVYANQADYAHALADYDKALVLKPGVTAYTEARDRTALRVNLRAGNNASAVAGIPACPIPSTQVPNYLEDTPEHLKKLIPDLRGLQSEKNDPEMTASVLEHTSAAVAAMMPKIPNLLAREEVKLDSDAGTVLEVPVGSGRGGRLVTGGGGRYQSTTVGDKTTVYTYRIIRRPDTPDSAPFDEFRTDAKNRPLSGDAASRNLGFAELWLLVAPDNLREANFRVLGRQKIAGHETFVLAFAQIPGRLRLGTLVGPASMRCIANIQGMLWVDQAAFHIVHMQTDLLAPIPALELTRLRSVLRYSEVKIPERALSLWLPTDIEISWHEGAQKDTETHRYSKYRLFAGTARLMTTVEGSNP